MRRPPRPVRHHGLAGRRLVVVTSEEGANRVYDASDVRFARHLGPSAGRRDVAVHRWRDSCATPTRVQCPHALAPPRLLVRPVRPAPDTPLID